MIRATDLFGNDGVLPASALRPEDEIHAPALFDHAAEAAALAGDRPVSQERAEVVSPVTLVKCTGCGGRSTTASRELGGPHSVDGDIRCGTWVAQ